jgi:hypothetical protein
MYLKAMTGYEVTDGEAFVKGEPAIDGGLTKPITINCSRLATGKCCFSIYR